MTTDAVAGVMHCILLHACRVLEVLNRTHVTITLASADKGWMDKGETGYLNVVAINTGAGMLKFPEVGKVTPLH